MHEIVIQICFVVAGMVTGCTDGVVQTNSPYLSSQDFSPVYVHGAPRCVSKHYRTSYVAPVIVRPRPQRRAAVVNRRHRHHHTKPKVKAVHRYHHHANKPAAVVVKPKVKKRRHKRGKKKRSRHQRRY